jgi:hypothetical protein
MHLFRYDKWVLQAGLRSSDSGRMVGPRKSSICPGSRIVSTEFRRVAARLPAVRSANFKFINFPSAGSTSAGDMVGAYGSDGYILQNGTFTTIDYPRAVATLPLAVNDDGTIVGIFLDTKGVLHGFKALPQ